MLGEGSANARQIPNLHKKILANALQIFQRMLLYRRMLSANGELTFYVMFPAEYSPTGIRGAPLDIGGGGGCWSFCCLQTFFLPPGENNFFFGDQRPTIFFLGFVEEIFCRMLPLLCRLLFGVFSGQHVFHKFRQQTFFFFPHFQQTFFSDFCGDKLFFSTLPSPPRPPPPTPQISNGASLISEFMQE